MLLVLQQNNLLAGAGSSGTVPDVVGDSQAAGISAIEGAGFVASVVTASSGVVPAGDIISQDPIAGTIALLGSTVTITVSLGNATFIATIAALSLV